MNQAILAMALHEREHSDAAGSALEEASQLITGLREIPGNKIHPDLLIAEILFREAEVRIKGNGAPSSKADQIASKLGFTTEAAMPRIIFVKPHFLDVTGPTLRLDWLRRWRRPREPT